MSERPRLGLDIGGTKTHGILLDAAGRVLAERVLPTERGAEGVIRSALAVTDACLDLAGIGRGDLDSVGIGVPGQVDHLTGTVRTAVNLDVSHLALGERLGLALGVPVAVDNDVKAAALAAAARLAASDLTYINVGTGVASATLADGRLVRGQGNLAGEIGHIALDPDGDRCACGQRGCLEVLVGGAGIAERLAALAPRVSLPSLFDAAAAGSPDAMTEATRISAGIATAVQLVVLTQGSSRVVLGGGVVHAARGLVDEVRRILTARAASSEFLTSLNLADRVIVLPSDYPVAAIGAALVGRATADAVT